VNRENKQKMVSYFSEVITSSSVVVVLHNLGLKVSEFSFLRKKLRGVGADCFVVKNTLVKLSLLNTVHLGLQDSIKGPSVLVCSQDILSVSKVLVSFVKNNKLLRIIVGSTGGDKICLPDINRLAELPPLDEIRLNLISIFRFSANKLVKVIKLPANNLATVFLNYSKK
jgi:large subunit ribosomal protein L10